MTSLDEWDIDRGYLFALEVFKLAKYNHVWTYEQELWMNRPDKVDD